MSNTCTVTLHLRKHVALFLKYHFDEKDGFLELSRKRALGKYIDTMMLDTPVPVKESYNYPVQVPVKISGRYFLGREPRYRHMFIPPENMTRINSLINDLLKHEIYCAFLNANELLNGQAEKRETIRIVCAKYGITDEDVRMESLYMNLMRDVARSPQARLQYL
jgi:hypothetical protein